MNNTASNDKLRRLLYSIAAFIGGAISIALPFFETFNLITPIEVFCGLCWITLAFFFKFSKISLSQLSNYAFITIAIQFSATELLNFLLFESIAISYFSSAINVLLNLVLFVAVSFLLHTPKLATRLSIIFIAATMLTLYFGSFNLIPDIRLDHISSIIEPLSYVLIAAYLIRGLAIFRNEASSAKLEAQLFEKLAYSDELTGIANRRKLVEVLGREISMTERYKTPLSIIIFDIDHFKKVNDTFGHDIGDKVLQVVATNSSNGLRATDLLGRWGGEEFLCILPQTTEQDSYKVAEHIRLIIQTSIVTEGPSVTASFGYTQLIETDDFDSFVRRADQALYNAKELGRNRCESIISESITHSESLAEITYIADSNTQPKPVN